MTFEPAAQVFLAVVREGERYVDTTAAGMPRLVFMKADELAPVIARRYTSVSARVEILGTLYDCQVFIPTEGNDFAYVACDDNLVPISSEPLDREPVPNFASYCDSLFDRVRFSEAVRPTESVDLYAHFIRPQFIRIPGGRRARRRRLATWDEFCSMARVVVLGRPGSGKTSALRRLALDLTLSTDQQQLPIYLQLRDLSEGGLDWSSIERTIVNLAGSSTAVRATSLAATGRLILLLDGLDEIGSADARSRVLAAIRDIARDFPQLRLVVSSRDTTYSWELADFTHLRLAPFNSAQVRQWVFLALGGRSSWLSFASSLEDEPHLFKVSKTPLLLSVAAGAYARHAIEPTASANVLEQCFRTLVEDWDASRGVRREDDWQWSLRSKYIVLGTIASHLVAANRTRWLTSECRGWLEPNNEAFDAAQALKVLSEATGLVRQTAKDEWAFVHKAFLEYLAARFAVDSLHRLNVLEKITEQDAATNSWLLACGLTSNADDLLEALLHRTEEGAMSRATLLARALCQEPNARRNVVRNACETIVKAIEAWLGRFTQVRNASDTRQRHSWVMTLRVVEPGAVMEDLAKPRRLLRAAYKMRSTSAGRDLELLLTESGLESVRHFSNVLKRDGRIELRASDPESLEVRLVERIPTALDERKTE